jgi:hypothetical protein
VLAIILRHSTDAISLKQMAMTVGVGLFDIPAILTHDCQDELSEIVYFAQYRNCDLMSVNSSEISDIKRALCKCRVIRTYANDLEFCQNMGRIND